MSNHTALYLRLSRDDGSEGASESIQNQKAFLLSYAAAHQFTVSATYEDDGYTGTNFDRPGFTHMLRDIEAHKIDTVLTKDLSRLGRDYIETGRYLEKYFPLHGVRYIAVSDGIDTALDGNGDDMSPFRAVFNDMYAKDISKKVRTALDTKKRSGKFIGAAAPYGYLKDAADKNHLMPDPVAAPYVSLVFRLFLSGASLRAAADDLTLRGIPTPSAAAGRANAASHWSDASVRHILTNPVYTGRLVQSRTKKLSYKLEKRISLPEEDWIVTEHAHEPIISEELFAQVQALLQKRAYHKIKRAGRPHALSGFVFCRDCGRPMTFVQESPSRCYLVCSSWKRHARLGLCTSHCIREDALEDAVRTALRCAVTPHVPWQELRSLKFPGPPAAPKQEQRHTQDVFVQLYEDKLSGLISEEEFTLLAQRLRAQKATQQTSSPAPSPDSAIACMRRLLTFDSLTPELLRLFLSQLTVGPEKEICIHLTFRSN